MGNIQIWKLTNLKMARETEPFFFITVLTFVADRADTIQGWAKKVVKEDLQTGTTKEKLWKILREFNEGLIV